MLKTMAAVIVNDHGDILPYTTQSTMTQCEEHAVEFFGEDVWHRLQSRGARVVPCEITLVE